MGRGCCRAATRLVCMSIIWFRLSTYSRGAESVGWVSSALPARFQSRRCRSDSAAIARFAASLPGTERESSRLASDAIVTTASDHLWCAATSLARQRRALSATPIA